MSTEFTPIFLFLLVAIAIGAQHDDRQRGAWSAQDDQGQADAL